MKKELSRKLEHPVWSPATLSLEDFLFSFSSIKKADSLTLIFELYACFLEQQGQSTEEGFDAFYHWGEMLLRDFEEVDHYLIDPAQVFTLVKDDRQLAESFYFLDEEQEKIIQNFWKDFLLVLCPNVIKNFVSVSFIKRIPVIRPLSDNLLCLSDGCSIHNICISC